MHKKTATSPDLPSTVCQSRFLQPRNLALTSRDSDRRPLKELRSDNRFDLGIKLFADFLNAPFAHGPSRFRRLAICRLASQLSAGNSLPDLFARWRRQHSKEFRRPKKRRVEAPHPEGAIRNLPRPPDRGDPAPSRREDSLKPYLLPT